MKSCYLDSTGGCTGRKAGMMQGRPTGASHSVDTLGSTILRVRPRHCVRNMSSLNSLNYQWKELTFRPTSHNTQSSVGKNNPNMQT